MHIFNPLQYPLNVFISYTEMVSSRLDFQDNLKTVGNSNSVMIQGIINFL